MTNSEESSPDEREVEGFSITWKNGGYSWLYGYTLEEALKKEFYKPEDFCKIKQCESTDGKTYVFNEETSKFEVKAK